MKRIPLDHFDPKFVRAVTQGAPIFTAGQRDAERLEWEAKRYLATAKDDPFPRARFVETHQVRRDVLNRWARPPVEIVSSKDQRCGQVRIYRAGVPIEDWVEAIAKGRADEPVLVICHPDDLEAVQRDLTEKGYEILSVEGDAPR